MDENQELEQNVGSEDVSEGEDSTKTRRARRSKEEMIADIEKKIEAENERHARMIAKLEEAKKNVLKPRMTKKAKAQMLVEEALKSHTPEELAEILRIDASQLFS